MGFESAEAIRQAILAEISLKLLQPQGQNAWGDRYSASIRITSPSGRSKQILTAWIVRFGEDIARFVTAVPDRKGEQS